MLVGHFAVGLAAKRIQPGVSAGTLVLASMFADLLWCVLMLAGIEHVQFKPVSGAGNYFNASNILISHSLAMDGVWAAMLSGAYYVRRRHSRGALLIFGVGLSHWILDWVSHRPDMPLAPGLDQHVGLGLWTSIPATVIVEGGLWAFALVLYALASRPNRRAGAYMYWVGIGVLTLAWYNNIAGPPPRDPATAPISSLGFFSLLVLWAYWIDKLRAGERSGRVTVRSTNPLWLSKF